METNELKAILIAGPTASGKSALALRLARQTGGTVINADSMQVYADLRVLSSRPSAEEEALAPHRLFGHVDGEINHSVGLWLEDVRASLALCRAEGRRPILVGCTGLYYKALTAGLSDIPAVPDEVRARVRAESEHQAPAALHARLAALDPATATRLRPTDPQRIIRALEVFEATGRPLISFQASRKPPLLPPDTYKAIFLNPDRAVLNAQIDRRFEQMVQGGALDEVEALRARRLDPALPAMRALGVPSLLGYLDGRLSLSVAIADGQTKTRQYAKR